MSFAKLDQDRIVAEALALLGEEGLAQVSLRKVAARLGVGVSSLYWHVEDKNALYRLMSARVFRSCVEAVPPSADWQAWLRAFGLAVWHAQVTTRDAHRLIAHAAVADGPRHEFRSRIIGTLEALGLDPHLAGPAQQSVQALVTGWTTLVPLQSARSDLEMLEQALDALIAGWDARTKNLALQTVQPRSS
jgi:TetR/AcrR family tetracycline transcriptional repressor